MFRRIQQILIKEFIQVFRDPRMRAVIFLLPVIQSLVFGYAVSTDVSHVPTAVYDLDNTPESRQLIREFSYSRYFSVTRYIYSDVSQKKVIDNSEVDMVLRINKGFAQDINAQRTTQIQLIIDGKDSNTAAVIHGYIGQIMGDYNIKLLRNRARIAVVFKNSFPGIELQSRAWFNENLLSRNYYVPGVIVLIITLITLLLSSMAIVREKEIGTMEQLMVSPIKPFELIVGKLLPFGIIALADALMVTLVATLFFHVPIRGNLLLLFVSSILFLMTTLGIGLFISTIAGTQQEAMMSTFFFFMPAMLLSGFLFPIQNMPPVIQYVTLINPLRYFLIIVRSIFLKGSGVMILWPQMAVLFMLGITILTISSLRFHKRLG